MGAGGFARIQFIILRRPGTQKERHLRKKFLGKRGSVPAGVACAFLLSGCLYSTHHFNTGRLLEPGRTSFTVGGGMMKSFRYGCDEESGSYEDGDSTRRFCVEHTQENDFQSGQWTQRTDTTEQRKFPSSAPKGSLGYRLGMSGPRGFITGAEIGLHLEAPTNPVSGEFDLKIGLPVPGGRPYHHSLSGGWGIGIWADNSYFLEYALSRAFGGSDLFASYRGTRLATQIADLGGSENDRRFKSKRRLIHQATFGFSWALPAIPVIPDFIVPMAVLSYPLAPFSESKVPDLILDDHLWDMSLGMGWRFQ